MVTYGFYNSINHDRVYDATQMSEIFDGIIRDGVYQYVGNKFLVDINGLEGFQVRVGTGRAWFNHTWTKNDAPLILTLPAPPTLDNYYRADAIVIDINANVNVRENKITYVTGTEVADNPSPPYPELLDGEHKQVALAYIVRKGAETEINAANINYVVGSNPCPYVTAPVQAVDLSAHVAQWQAAWEQWFQGPNGYVQTQKRAFEAEIAAAEADIENATENVNEDVAEFRVWIASQKSQFDGWMDDSKDDFDIWFANLHYILDGDAAGHLQNEIEALDNRVVPIEKGGTGNTHGHIQGGQKRFEYMDGEYPIGEFATAEGMNTIASGKCSHAEGGGDYTEEHHNAGFIGDDIHTSEDASQGGIDLSITDNGEENSTSWGTYDPSKSIGSFNNLNSFYVAMELVNNTTGEVLMHKIGALGPASKNSKYYIGYLNDNNDPVPTYISTTPHDNVDVGILASQYVACTGYGSGLTKASIYDGHEYDIKNYLPEPCLEIELPWTGKSNTVSLMNVPAKTEYSESFSPKTVWAIDPTTNKVLGIYYGQFSDWNATIYGIQTLSLSIKGSINQDYSFGLYYQNWHPSKKNVKLYFSNGTFTPPLSTGNVEITGIVTVYIPQNEYTSSNCSVFFKGTDLDNKSNDRGLYLKVNGGESGTTYKVNFYYSYATGSDPEKPIDWIPAGTYILPGNNPPRAVGNYSHAEGYGTKASGIGSHAEGYAINDYALEENNPGANGNYSHAEGYTTWANGTASHAEGRKTKAVGDYSHTEGYECLAEGTSSHAGGSFSEAIGDYSFVHGYNLRANDKCQILFGENYNISGSGYTPDIKRLYTTIFGLGLDPRFLVNSSDDTINLSSIDVANEIANKNMNGFTTILKCPSNVNGIFYKTLMPSNTFGTFLEFIEVIGGEPSNQYISYSGRILKIWPSGASHCGIVEAGKLFDYYSGTGNSAINAVTLLNDRSVSIGGDNYQYPIINIQNSVSNMVSDSTKTVYIKYVLMRLM